MEQEWTLDQQFRALRTLNRARVFITSTTRTGDSWNWDAWDVLDYAAKRLIHSFTHAELQSMAFSLGTHKDRDSHDCTED